VPLQFEDGAAMATFTLRANQAASFILEDARDESGSDAARYVADSFKRTLNFWREWIGHCRYHGRWREIVNRSALTLKPLVSRRFGSLVAAPTFGLPEVIGGERNWDYRYTWIRDAAFTIYALMRLGYTEDAGAFNQWIEQRCHELNPDGSLQIMFGIDGRHELPEETLEHWSGYRDSRPVRIGNSALRENARLCKPRWTLRGATGTAGPTPRKLSPSLHSFGPDQRGICARPRARADQLLG
jgi:GH15 family glucan-1,4-alpha-glucosidase